MMLMTDLFASAYVPCWYLQLDELAKLALPEPCRFKHTDYVMKNTDTPILERYIHYWCHGEVHQRRYGGTEHGTGHPCE